jgi:hypothetical protein
MLIKKIDRYSLISEGSRWHKIDDVLLKPSLANIEFLPVIDGDEEGNITWLRHEIESIKTKYLEQEHCPSAWVGQVYITSVDVPAVNDPYHHEYSGLAFALLQGNSGWVFASKDDITTRVLLGALPPVPPR